MTTAFPPWPRFAPATAVMPHTRSFVYASVLATIVIFSPSKLLAYCAPAIFILTVYLFSGHLFGLNRILISLLLFSGVCGAYAFAGVDIFPEGAILQVLTLSSFLALAVFRRGSVSYTTVLYRLLPIIGVIFLFESFYGLLQAAAGFVQSGTFDVANGDHVQGTIYPFFNVDSAFANPMFSANMILGLICFWPHIRRLRNGVFILSSMLTCIVLASVLHQLLFALIAWVVAPQLNTVSWAQVKRIALVVVTATITAGAASFVLRENLSSWKPIYDDFESRNSPRRIMLDQLTTTLPDENPWQPLVGFGPAQFCSRAAMIATGLYFQTTDVERFMRTRVTEPQSKYLMSLWKAALVNRYYGSSQKPFFSWLSVYTEYGALGIALVLWLVLRLIWRVRQSSRRSPDPGLWNSIQAAILFLMLLGFQENYWEIPQAVFLGILLTTLNYRVAQETALEVAKPKRWPGAPSPRFV